MAKTRRGALVVCDVVLLYRCGTFLVTFRVGPLPLERRCGSLDLSHRYLRHICYDVMVDLLNQRKNKSI